MRKGGLRIAIFHLAFIYSGGGEKLVLQEAEGLKGLGHEVEIFTSVVKRSNCFPDYIKKFQIKTFLPQRLIDKKTGLRFAKKTSGSLSTRLLGKFKPFIKWADEVSINNSIAFLSNGDYM